MNACIDMEERLFWLRQGELSRGESLELEKHLEACPGCRSAVVDWDLALVAAAETPAPEPWDEAERQRFEQEVQAKLKCPATASREGGWTRWAFRPLFHMAAGLFLMIGTAFGVAWERASWSSESREQAVGAYLSLAHHAYSDLKNFDEAFVYYGLAVENEAFVSPEFEGALELGRRRLRLLSESQDKLELLARLVDAENLSASDRGRAIDLCSEIMRSAPDHPIAWAAAEFCAEMVVAEEVSFAQDARPDVDRLKSRLRKVFDFEGMAEADLLARVERLQSLKSLSNRGTAAYAQLSIAALYRHHGKLDDAKEAYTLIIKEYGDIDAAVQIARQRLGELP